ncbi:Alpha/Beta hydrolase protein [Mycena rebaudengoi]|nr:Alpha/Beta hydrolase protein [Mycena rebaudengoi]
MRFPFSLAAVAAVQAAVSWAAFVSVNTTSGLLRGLETNGLLTFKGIRFAHPPTGLLRWEPPAAFTSAALQNSGNFGPSCVQQFSVGVIYEQLFNTPPLPESEDCLFLNVWAPAPTKQKLPVLIWIYGGGLAFGAARDPEYDGASIASNKHIVVVSFNYRLNVFGFPGSADLPLDGNNLGFLDQELAFKWVQQNIARFGGDPQRVTIMGQSAGSLSVSAAISRHSPSSAPFRAAIMLSLAQVSTPPTPSFALFDGLASAVGCKQAPGATRLACLREVSASAIRTVTNGPSSGFFGPSVDNLTFFSDPLQRIRTGLTARVPFIIGNTQDDRTLSAFNMTDLAAFLVTIFGSFPTADEVRSLYPSGLNDNAIISEAFRDFGNLCPAGLWAGAAVGAGVTNVYRYTYGPVFADLQPFPNAGAWHTSELPEIFGTFNRSTAKSSEVELSHTMQTLIANFVKNPSVPPAWHWPKYVPGNTTTTLARLAYEGNVALGNVVQVAESDSVDGPCDALWNQILDVRL